MSEGSSKNRKSVTGRRIVAAPALKPIPYAFLFLCHHLFEDDRVGLSRWKLKTSLLHIADSDDNVVRKGSIVLPRVGWKEKVIFSDSHRDDPFAKW